MLEDHQRVKDAIHEDADFYVTTEGVLGEQLLAIEPGTPQRPVLAENSIVKGIDPPRLDLFLSYVVRASSRICKISFRSRVSQTRSRIEWLDHQ